MTDMLKDGHELWQEWKAFYRREKFLCWFTALILWLCYGIRLAYGDIFIDSEIMFTDPEAMLHSWYGLGRYGLVGLKWLSGMGRLAPLFANVLLLVLLWFFAIGFCFCLYDWSGGVYVRQKGECLFVLLFLSAPCLAEQFNFVLQASEIAFAMVLCLLAVFCAGQRIYKGKTILWLFLSVALMVGAFGCYQAFPAFYIGLVLVSYITVYLYRKAECGFREGVWHAGAFLLAFFLSQMLSKMVRVCSGADSSYFEKMFQWRQEGLEVCLEQVRVDVWRVYLGVFPVFLSRWFSEALLCALLFLAAAGIRRKRSSFPCFLLALMLLAVTPVLITLVTGMNQPMRGQLAYVLVFAFAVQTVYDQIQAFPLRSRWGRQIRKGLGILALLLGVRMGWGQCVLMNQLWETGHEYLVSDKLTAERLYRDICQTADMENMADCKVILIGERGRDSVGNQLQGDVIGHSFFQWDADSIVGVNGRTQGFFEMLGMPSKLPDQQEYQEAAAAGGQAPVWPAKGSVFKLHEDMVVVKLSELP